MQKNPKSPIKQKIKRRRKIKFFCLNLMKNRYFIHLSNSVKKSVEKIPQPWQKRILDILTILEINPFMGTKMQGGLSDKRKIVIWPYRIIYQINKKEKSIIVVEVKHRGNVSYD